jgi:hypothetical protein
MPPDDIKIAWHSMPPDVIKITWLSMPPDDKEIAWPKKANHSYQMYIQHQKLGVLSVIKQLQRSILCNMMYYGALKSNID